MGFRGSRVQIPPSRLGEESALQRVPLWGFFFVGPRAVSNAVSFARLSAHKPMRRVQHDVLDRLGVSQKSNRLVVSVLAWVSRSIEQVRRGLADEDRKRRESAQAKELEEQAAKIADLLNEDFKVGRVKSPVCQPQLVR